MREEHRLDAGVTACGSPASAKKKKVLARRRCASSMLPETSSAKMTAA